MKRVYISGKITGLELHEAKKLFLKAENIIKAKGNIPMNPMTMNPYNQKFHWSDYMRLDIKILMCCDAIYMISNWKDSKGAIIEHDLAKKLGFKIIYQE